MTIEIGNWIVEKHKTIHLCGGRGNKTIRWGRFSYCSLCNKKVPWSVYRCGKRQTGRVDKAATLRYHARTAPKRGLIEDDMPDKTTDKKAPRKRKAPAKKSDAKTTKVSLLKMEHSDREGFLNLTFTDKPSDDTRQELKDSGFWWSRKFGRWYGPAETLPDRYKSEYEKIESK